MIVVVSYDVTIVRTSEWSTAVVKANTTWGEFPSQWPGLLDEVWAFLRVRAGPRADGHNVMQYRTNVPGVEVAVEVGVEVTEPIAASGRVVPSMLPAVEAAATVRVATGAEIGAAHSAIRDWCAAQGHELTGVAWEVYGHADPQTGGFDVTVYYPLA